MQLTANEAAAVTGLSEAEVRKDVQLGVLEPGSPPRFDEPELVYMKARRDLGFQLSVEDRKRLLGAISTALAEGAPEVRLGAAWVLRVGESFAGVREQISRFESWKAERVSSVPDVQGGEPVFVGTRLPVRDIASRLLRTELDPGALQAELLEDYPYLSAEDLAFARMFGLAYPRIGRPRASSAA